MLYAGEVLEAVVQSVRDTPALMEQIAEIRSLDELIAPTQNIADVLRSLTPSSMLVTYRGTEQWGEFDRWAHRVSIYLKADSAAAERGGYFQIWSQFVNGIHTPSGLRLYDAPIHDDCDPMAGIGFDPLNDSDGTEFWCIRFLLPERAG